MIKRCRQRYMPLIVLLVVFMALQPTLVGARERYRLPPGKRLTVQSETFQGYSLEEFKLLLKMDVDLESFSKQVPKYIKLQEDLTKLNVNLNERLELAQSVITILHGERDRLTKKWTEENRLRHLAENKPSILSWLGWGAAAVMGIVATVLAVILVVKSDK